MTDDYFNPKGRRLLLFGSYGNDSLGPQPHQSRHQKGKRLQGAPGIEQKRVKAKNLRSRHSHFTLMSLDANLVWKRNLHPEFGAHAMHPGVATLSLVLSKSNLIS